MTAKDSVKKKSKIKTPWRKILVYISISVIIILLPIALYLFFSRSTTGVAWFDSNWLYRVGITIQNSTSGTLTDEDVLIEIDTASLVTAGKLQSDCDDLRFIDSDDSTGLAYWIEGGCNTSSTQVWVKIPSLPSDGKSVYMYYGNESATNAQESWSGNFVVLSTVSCPTGWSRATEFDNRFPYGSEVFGDISDGLHNHGQATCTTAQDTVTQQKVCTWSDEGTKTRFVNRHTHSNARVDIENAAIVPPYFSYFFCSNSEFSIFENVVIYFDQKDRIPNAWVGEEASDGKFPMGAEEYGLTGGSLTHIHTTKGGYNTDEAIGILDGVAGGYWIPGTHYHTTIDGNTASGDNNTPYYDLLLYKANTSNTPLDYPFITMSTAIPPLGWKRYQNLDNRFPRVTTTEYPDLYDSVGHTHSVSIVTGNANASQSNSSGCSSYRSPNHSHSCVTTSSSVIGLPAYVSTVFIERHVSEVSILGEEEMDNSIPNAPTSLLTEGQSNPVAVTDTTPEFSAIFSDDDSEDTASYYQIQVNTSSDFTGTTMWDSFKTVFGTPVVNGQRTPEISYSGSELEFGTTYYWRIKMWDQKDAESEWSSVSQFSMLGIPGTPTIGTPTALSTNTIRWNFTDNSDTEEGFILYDLEDNLIQYCLGSNISYCDETGLDENVQYTRKVASYNQVGTSEMSESVSAYTLVSKPTIATGPTKTSSSISLLATGIVGNSEIYFECTDSNCNEGIGIWNTEEIGTATQLTHNTPYNFRVKGRNGDGVETEYSDSITIYTLSNTPSLSKTPLSSSAISLTAENVNNLSLGNSGIYFECEKEDCNQGIKEWGRNTTSVVSGLSPNTLYFFKIKARNYDGVETSFSEYAGTYTLAVVPSKPLISNIKTTALTVAMDVNGNPEDTQYSLFEEKSGKYVNLNTKAFVNEPVWGTYSNWGSTNGVEITGLQVGTEYIFKAKARNADLLETDFSESSIAVTKLLTPTTLSATTITANTITWSVTDSNASKTGFKIYDTNDNLLITCLVNKMTDCIERNLDSNTSYSRKVKTYSAISESDFSNTFIVNTYAQPSTISSISAISPQAIQLNIVGGNRDNIQILENNLNLYFNGNLGTLTQTQSLTPFASSIEVSGLQPNRIYEFKVRSLNTNNIATTWSSVQSTYTHAQTPTVLRVDTVNSSTARVFINGLSNPSDTEYSVRESNTGRHLDFNTGNLGNTERWGNISNWGGNSGIQVNNLEIGTQYGFSVRARNKQQVNTPWSTGVFIGTKAILKNVDSSVRATLQSSEETDLTKPEFGQFGEKVVRVRQGELLLADIPVLFSEDRDWNDAVILSSVKENKTVVKLNEQHGISKPYTLYVVQGTTNSFVLCPGAKKLEDVSINCTNGIKYEGPYPQSIKYQNKDITVSQSVIGGIAYWVADGITGTGGQGYFVEAKKIVEEKKEQGPIVVSTPTVSRITQRTSEIVQIFKDTALGIIDTLPVKEMKEAELQTVTTTANVVTITVGATTLLGGVTQLVYSVIQFFTVILSSIGFRKKRVKYGFVYDSKSKEPVHMALVRIYNTRKRLVETAVTDINGRFAGTLEKGKYEIKVSKSGYGFPSVYVKGTTDYPLQNIYSGALEILSEDSDIQIAIPIDPKDILGGKKYIYNLKSIVLKILSVLNVVIFIVGISLSIYTYSQHTNPYNLLLLLLYTIPLYILLNSIFNKKGKYGKVVDENGKPVSDVSVIIKEKEFDKVIAKRVTNSKGKYRFILDKGNYEISVAERSYHVLDVKGGAYIEIQKDNHILSKKIKIRKV